MVRGFDGVKVFSATTAQRRAGLGEAATDWLAANPQVEAVGATLVQSSDEAHHCITLVVFYVESARA